ncbi:phage tail sheath C-terminal domain-containing protein [Cupriavidus sp. IK-TO18]|uniref:phage tail sheath C-terminal domain-containing protein n=1 Tax=Cupriavidus sp. IK-TO18 TaxID=2782182 RepID=UPI00189AA50E|nr:phage tail sheath C-terminal domain-containing protein [Cupriavidus sp. IK-TO18]MBF6986233.1 phage tail sheath subtilisin-like domain-containing protein [Cupriavidus sp. IK-TO18]
MPEYLAPGVYVEETQASNKPIEGVSTSTTGLVGVTERGPLNVPQLVTSFGEFQRLFGGMLPADEFTGPGARVHSYLPHAVEGFFLNGGKRAWVTRVLPEQAERARRDLFHLDLANAAIGGSVLLRPALQDTGTAINLPRLYVLDPGNFGVGDWVRVGDGSRADYRQVQALGAAPAHTALTLPLYFSHAAGAPTRDIAVTVNATLSPFTLRDDTRAGATEVVLSGTAALITTLLPLTHQLLQVDGAEYVFAAAVVGLSTTEARVLLETPLRLPHARGAQVDGLDIPAGANVNLDVAASAGGLLLFGPGFSTAGNLVVVGVGSAQEEVQRVGTLAQLPLDVPAYAPYPAGTIGQLVTLDDDARTVVDLPTNVVVPLDTVAGMSAGMTFTFGANNQVVAAVNQALGLVRLAAPLPGPALAAGDAVQVGAIAASVVAYPTERVVPLDSVNGVETGMTFDNAGDTALVATVLPDLRAVVLATALAAAPAAGTAVTVGGNANTAQSLLRPDVIPLDDVDGLAPGMSITIGADTGTISAVNTTVGAVALQAPLPAAPAAGATASFALRHTTQAAGAGATTLALDNRLGLDAGDVLRIGASPDEEYVTIARMLGERGVSPDAGVVQLAHPLSGGHASGVEVARQDVVVDTTRQPATLVLSPADGSDQLLVGDGTTYGAVLPEVVRFTTADGIAYFHRLDGAAANASPLEIELDDRLDFSHAAGAVVAERNRLFAVQALDAGGWGDRLMVAAADEASSLAANANVLAANPPPGPGMFSSLQLATLTGIEPGTILELLAPDGAPVAGAPLLKARAVDRASRLVLLDPPGLQAAHMNAVNNALMAGLNARVRSREWSLTVLLRQRPDPAVPTRNDNLLDQESFRQLSMDPRHSRYFERVIGATFTPGAPADDAGNPLRRWDRRSEGASQYIRVLDLEPVIANRTAIRLGPEALLDVLPSGLVRPARLPLSGGSDAVPLMGDPMYAGTDNNEPDLRTGLQALKNPQNISLVAIPGQTTAALQQALIDQCEAMRYRFAVLDGPPPDNDTLADVQDLRSRYDSRYAAVYHPWLTIPDPFPQSLANLRQVPIPPSGHMLGIYARVDNERGVHKAPANEVVRGISGLTRYFSKGEQDILNPYPANINVVRDFRPNNRGLRVWGARCITSESEFKYLNVRRLLIFLEDSIDRGMQWVVFEPNAEELWARVRRSITNFLTTVWRNGALEGTTPEQGFFVKCDRTTMTRDDIDNGRLIVVIGVAPVKPAEYVIIRIGLWTADAEQ